MRKLLLFVFVTTFASFSPAQDVSQKEWRYGFGIENSIGGLFGRTNDLVFEAKERYHQFSTSLKIPITLSNGIELDGAPYIGINFEYKRHFAQHFWINPYTLIGVENNYVRRDNTGFTNIGSMQVYTEVRTFQHWLISMPFFGLGTSINIGKRLYFQADYSIAVLSDLRVWKFTRAENGEVLSRSSSYNFSIHSPPYSTSILGIFGTINRASFSFSYIFPAKSERLRKKTKN